MSTPEKPTSTTTTAFESLSISYHKQKIPPFQIIQSLGLSQFLINHLVFKTKKQKYNIRKIKNRNYIIAEEIYNPQGFYTTVQIIKFYDHHVPVCSIKPIKCINKNVVIYAHGNYMDLLDSALAVQSISKQLNTQFIVFDYTGYGCSQEYQKDPFQITEETIRRDLQIVICWLIKEKQIKMENIILWGFSLGTYPVVYLSSKYEPRAVILQSPLASLALFLKSGEIHPMTFIENDYLVNLNYIDKIKSEILIIHSRDDKVIPFQHSLALFQKYVWAQSVQNIQFVQVDKINHNEMNMYFSTSTQNKLKKVLFDFIKEVSFVSRIKSSLLRDTKSSEDPSVKYSELDSFRKRRLKLSLVSSKSGLDSIMNKIELIEVEQFNNQSEQIQVIDGRIRRNSKIRMGGCFCKEKC